MMRAVQASFTSTNSSDENPRHHLCPKGPNPWCKYQKAIANKVPYTHKNPPIPSAIVQVIKPMFLIGKMSWWVGIHKIQMKVFIALSGDFATKSYFKVELLLKLVVP